MNWRDSMVIYDHWSYMTMLGVLDGVGKAFHRHHRYQNPDAEVLRHFQYSPQSRLQQVGILTQHTHAATAQEGVGCLSTPMSRRRMPDLFGLFLFYSSLTEWFKIHAFNSQ